MTIHKMWMTRSKEDLEKKHGKAMTSFKKLNRLIKNRDLFNLKELEHEFKKQFKPNPRYINHTSMLLVKLSNMNEGKLLQAYKGLMSTLPIFYKQVRDLRKSFLCSLCEWYNHNYFDIDSMTVTYSNSFCTMMMPKFINLLKSKYVDLFGFMLQLDEFIFLVTDKHLMENPKDRIIFHRYYLMVEKCSLGADRLSNCIDLCMDFSLNKFSYLFDGEESVLDDYLDKFFDISELITGKKPEFLQLMQTKKPLWKNSKLDKFAKKISVLSPILKKDPNRKFIKSNSFSLQFKSKKSKRFVERKHRLSEMQIEMLDDSLNELVLYRLADEPIDITDFVITFGELGGINLYRDMEKMNIEAAPDEILALLHHKMKVVGNLSEYIEKSVQDLLKTLMLTDFNFFLSDERMVFKNIKPEHDNKKNDPVLLATKARTNSTQILLYLTTSLFLLLLPQ